MYIWTPEREKASREVPKTRTLCKMKMFGRICCPHSKLYAASPRILSNAGFWYECSSAEGPTASFPNHLPSCSSTFPQDRILQGLNHRRLMRTNTGAIIFSDLICYLEAQMPSRRNGTSWSAGLSRYNGR